MLNKLRDSWLNTLGIITTDHTVREELDKRGDVRFSLQDCFADVLAPSRAGEFYRVVVTDVSFHGIGLCSPMMIPDHQAIEIKFCTRDDVYPIQVRWRCVEGQQCRIGGQIMI